MVSHPPRKKLKNTMGHIYTLKSRIRSVEWLPKSQGTDRHQATFYYRYRALFTTLNLKKTHFLNITRYTIRFSIFCCIAVNCSFFLSWLSQLVTRRRKCLNMRLALPWVSNRERGDNGLFITLVPKV